MLSQRNQLQKIEFQSIARGLEKSCQCDEVIESQIQRVQSEKSFKRKNNLLKSVSNINIMRTDPSTGENQYLEDKVYESQQQKYDKLKKQPPSFFDKIPKDPLTLMNSTRKNKQVQINILATSKQAVIDHIKNKSKALQLPAQDAAVRSLLDNFQTQFNFRSALDAKKKRQVEDLKQKYFKTFFIKNIPAKDKIIYKYYGETCRDDKYKTNTQFTKTSHKPFTSSFQSGVTCSETECTGYCQYLKEIFKRRNIHSQSHRHIGEFITNSQ